MTLSERTAARLARKASRRAAEADEARRDAERASAAAIVAAAAARCASSASESAAAWQSAARHADDASDAAAAAYAASLEAETASDAACIAAGIDRPDIARRADAAWSAAAVHAAAAAAWSAAAAAERADAACAYSAAEAAEGSAGAHGQTETAGAPDDASEAPTHADAPDAPGSHRGDTVGSMFDPLALPPEVTVAWKPTGTRFYNGVPEAILVDGEVHHVSMDENGAMVADLRRGIDSDRHNHVWEHAKSSPGYWPLRWRFWRCRYCAAGSLVLGASPESPHPPGRERRPLDGSAGTG